MTIKEINQTAKADAGKLQISLVPTQIIRDIAEVRMYGNAKYGSPDNWKTVDLARYIDALLRHTLAFMDDIDSVDAEKVLPGCDFCKIELNDYPYIVAHSDYSSSDTCYEPGFCPICGKPLTDEAVDMVMERMETINNA